MRALSNSVQFKLLTRLFNSTKLNDKSDTNIVKLDVNSRLILQTTVRELVNFSLFYADLIKVLSSVTLTEDFHTIVEKMSTLLCSFIVKLDSAEIIKFSDDLFKIAKNLSNYNHTDCEDIDNVDTDEDYGDWGSQMSDGNDSGDTSYKVRIVGMRIA